VVEVPVFVCETHTKGCHARCQVLCGCNPTMQHVRLRINILYRKCLMIIHVDMLLQEHTYYTNAHMHKLTQTHYGATSNLKTDAKL
jgi:hypothetical protein